MFQRNQFTASQLHSNDKKVIAAQHKARVSNQPSSHHSQLPKSTNRLSRFNSPTTPDVGSIVYLKNDRTKHKARDQYMVASTEGDWLVVKKLLKGRLCARGYRIHKSECFSLDPVKPCHPPDSQPISDTDDGQPNIHHDPSDTESSSTDDEPIQPVLLPVAEDTTKKLTPMGNVTGSLPDDQITPSYMASTSL